MSTIFEAAFGKTATVMVHQKSTQGHSGSWAFITFVQPYAAARARLAGKLCVLPEALKLLSSQPTTMTSATGCREEIHPQQSQRQQQKQQQEEKQEEVAEKEGDKQEEKEPVMLHLEEATIPPQLEHQRRHLRRQMHSEQGECPSPIICGTDVPPCAALARLWAEQQVQLDRANASACLDLFQDNGFHQTARVSSVVGGDDSSKDSKSPEGGPTSSQLRWSPKGGLVPLLFKCSTTGSGPSSPCRSTQHATETETAGR